MGVEYEHYLVPDDPTYKPDAHQISRLVNALHDGGYAFRSDVHDPVGTTFSGFSSECDTGTEGGCVVERVWNAFAKFPCPGSASDVTALSNRDFRLIWSIDDLAESGLKYPLSKIPDEHSYWDLELHVPVWDYVYHMSEVIDPFDRPAAGRCGQVLEYVEENGASNNFGYPVFADTRIHRFCPICRAPFRPQDYSLRLKSAYAGKDLGTRPGGAVYLFAIVIDCGKCFIRDEPPTASEEFLRICADAIGTRLFQLGDIN
jgi:hypothetical protein